MKVNYRQELEALSDEVLNRPRKEIQEEYNELNERWKNGDTSVQYRRAQCWAILNRLKTD